MKIGKVPPPSQSSGNLSLEKNSRPSKEQLSVKTDPKPDYYVSLNQDAKNKRTEKISTDEYYTAAKKILKQGTTYYPGKDVQVNVNNDGIEAKFTEPKLSSKLYNLVSRLVSNFFK